MADKKTIPITDNDDDIEKHVDQMMDKDLPDAKPKHPLGAPDLPEIDIFAGTDMAPDPGKTKDDTDESAAAASDPAEKITEDTSVESLAVDPLVDDIISDEGNELLAAQDAEIGRAFDNKPPSFKQKVKNFFAAWWHNKKARYGTLAGIVVLLIVASTVPASRYFMLNTAGVRAKASLTILDKTTNLPLKNVAVTLGSQTAKTDKQGTVKLSSVKLGSQQLVVQQLGFAKVSQHVTLGLGSNPLGEFSLRAVGTQFMFELTDFVSGKAIKDAEVAEDGAGDANAKSDKNGNVILTVGKISDASLKVKVSATGYRTEKLAISTTETKETAVSMVSAREEVFVSKQSGKYDLYKIDIDGKNKKVLLAGTGLERSTLGILVHQTDNTAAFVSSRDDKRDQDGYLLDTLTIVDVNDGSTLTLDHSQEIRLINWSGDRLVYLKVKAGSSAGNPERYQLISYDYKTTNRQVLASANYFNDVVLVKDSLYYAFSDNYRGGPSQFAKVNDDGTGKQVLLTAQVWNVMRTSYGDMNLYGGNDWYGYHVGDSAAKKLAQPPTNTNERRSYVESPDDKHALWVDNRDGKGVLLSYDISAQKDTTLVTQSGLGYPLRWLDNHTVVYRVSTSTETASYVVSLDGGPAKKITDVTNTGGSNPYGY